MPAQPRLPDRQNFNWWDALFTFIGHFVAIPVMLGCAGVVGILGSALYPLKKTLNAIRNLVARQTKIARSFYRLAGIGGGTYVGWTYGTAIGATCGSALPFAGTAVGALVGGIIGIAVGGITGALFTKYSAKLLSKHIHGDTNPDKWTLTPKQGLVLAKKLDHDFDPTTTRMGVWLLRDVFTAMDAVDAAKKTTQGPGSIPGTFSRTYKGTLNELLRNIKKGDFRKREPENKLEEKEDFSQCTIDYMSGNNETASTLNQLNLLCDVTGCLYYFWVNDDGQKTSHFLMSPDSNTKKLTNRDIGLGLNTSPEWRDKILRSTSRQGHTGGKPAIKMTDATSEAALVQLYRAGFFKHNRSRATEANSQEKNPKMRQALGG